DRCNEQWIQSAFWPDATDDHGTFSGNAYEFAKYLMTSLKRLSATSHFLGNIHIELDGEEHARVESYVTAFHELANAPKPAAAVLGGRYLDRFERRGGEWRIARRVFVLDWQRTDPNAHTMAAALAVMKNRG